MYSSEQVFIWDIDALRQIDDAPTAAGLLEASARLRRLLTDAGEPLVHKVSRGRDFKPSFRVPIDDGYEAIVQIIGEAPDHYFTSPYPEDGKPTRTLGLDAFLALPAHYAAGVALTVKHLINYVANVGGGVHLGKPSNRDNAPIIHDTADTFYMNGAPYPLHIMRPVVRVTLEALDPLYRQLQQ